MKICSIEDCGKSAKGRGWCNTHYARWRKHGDPNGGGRRYTDPETVFRERTTQADNGCLEWTGYKNPKGYGMLKAAGKVTLAHRHAWAQANGPIPRGAEIDHKCHNRACVNVEHLRVVTRKQNLENYSGPGSRNKSGYRGVSWHKPLRKWVVKVSHNGRNIHVGYFSTAEEANVAAIEARNQLHTHNDVDRVA